MTLTHEVVNGIFPRIVSSGQFSSALAVSDLDTMGYTLVACIAGVVVVSQKEIPVCRDPNPGRPARSHTRYYLARVE